MQADPFKERAPREEDKAFRALFGCCTEVACKLWSKMDSLGLLSEGGLMTHLLWALTFLKVCPSEETMKQLAGGADSKTIRKWVNTFAPMIVSLESHAVSQSFQHNCIGTHWFVGCPQFFCSA